MPLDPDRLGSALHAAATAPPSDDPLVRWKAIAAAIIAEITANAQVPVPSTGLVSGGPGAPVTGAASGTIL